MKRVKVSISASVLALGCVELRRGCCVTGTGFLTSHTYSAGALDVAAAAVGAPRTRSRGRWPALRGMWIAITTEVVLAALCAACLTDSVV